MSYENILVEKQKSVEILFINRPQVHNALNEATLLEIDEEVKRFAQDETMAVLIITGSGQRSFVAGADIAAQSMLDATQGRNWGLLGHRVFRLIESLEKPVIAAINGYALGGGCELAMACDIRLASDQAIIGLTEVTLGITPGYGGTQRLVRLVGEGKAKQMVFTGKKIKAEEAHCLGLVDEVFPHTFLLEEAIKMAEVIASNAPLAVRYAKLQINQSLQINYDISVAIESGLFGLCFATHDQKEGMRAFMEKRKPQFEGK